MAQLLADIDKVKLLSKNNITLKLLRANNMPLIITFLYRTFKASEEIAINDHVLELKLAQYLEDIQYADQAEGTEKMPNQVVQKTAAALFTEPQDYEAVARKYLNDWVEAHYLRKVIDDNTKEPLVLLSKHTEKAFQAFDLLKEREFVGTESKFKDIFTKLRDIVENANPDKERRLEELKKRKKQIEAEIRGIKAGGSFQTYEDFQVKSRFEEVSRLANELVGDFKEVEDNFKEITRYLYERQQQGGLSKGRLIAETFDALYELKKTDQGKSFYAFWQFMLNDTSQEELQYLTREVYKVLEQYSIEAPSRSLRKLKTLLHLAARKVLDKNSLLAQKLGREIVAKDQLAARRSKELMAGIRQLALQKVAQPNNDTIYLTIEGSPAVYLPLERKLGEQTAINTYTAEATAAVLTAADLEGLQQLYNTDFIDKQVLLANINDLLQQHKQVSLLQVVQAKGLTRGLAEVLGYIALVGTSAKFFINDQSTEHILFDAPQGKYLQVPMVIYSR